MVKETLRLRPILALVLRQLTEPMEIGGRLLPAGVNGRAVRSTSCTAGPDVYPEPLRFRPERFLEGQGGTYTWIPFGGGVRRCLGASFAQFEMKIVLQEVVKRLALRPADPRPEPRRAPRDHARPGPRRRGRRRRRSERGARAAARRRAGGRGLTPPSG